MERTAEPELMDEQEQAAAYAGEDWSDAHGKIPGYFRDRFPHFERGQVIDLGCGAADVAIRFARAFPGTTITAVDGSEPMLDFGRRHVHQAGLDFRITFEKRYLPDTQLQTRTFDAVISNSLLHHLAEPATIWRTAALCAKPGAPVLIVDLTRPKDHDTALRIVNERAKAAPPMLQRDFLASLHAAYTVEEVRRQLLEAGLPNFKVDQTDEFHFVAWGVGLDRYYGTK
jgi:2-polyprenyl-3-methyl-5-hydroxy-6-metoxy-1,4-benzoquinol methylase